MDYLEKLFSLKNKTILVTGAARGNGKTISIALSKLGANLIICDCLSAELDKTYKQIKIINTKVNKYNFDLRKINEIKSELFEICINLGSPVDPEVNMI